MIARLGRGADLVQHVEPFGIGCHESVFDAVVDHLDEMPGADRPDVQIAARGAAAASLGRRALRGQRREYRLELLHGCISPPIIRQ